METKAVRADRRQKRVRAKMHGTKEMPRLSVHRTGKYVYAQLIDDEQSVTLVGVSEAMLGDLKATKTEKAKALGKLMAEKAKEAKVTKAVFDRGAYRYHGRVRAFAEGAREGGLAF